VRALPDAIFTVMKPGALGPPPLRDLRPLVYSRTCQIGLRAMERLAARWDGADAWTRQADLAREIGVPATMLAQVLQRLRRAGLVAARRGPSGGVRVAGAPGTIPVRAVIQAIDGAGVEGRCLLGFADCSDAAPCPAHPAWKHAKESLNRRLERRSLADLVTAVERKRRRAARSPGKTKRTASR
jgi:Rrf2 family iron-sulfur cluster assembly transcriptional regulator